MSVFFSPFLPTVLSNSISPHTMMPMHKNSIILKKLNPTTLPGITKNDFAAGATTPSEANVSTVLLLDEATKVRMMQKTTAPSAIVRHEAGFF